MQPIDAIRATFRKTSATQTGIELAKNATAVNSCQSSIQNLGTRYAKSRAFRDRDAGMRDSGVETDHSPQLLVPRFGIPHLCNSFTHRPKRTTARQVTLASRSFAEIVRFAIGGGANVTGFETVSVFRSWAVRCPGNKYSYVQDCKNRGERVLSARSPLLICMNSTTLLSAPADLSIHSPPEPGTGTARRGATCQGLVL